MSFSSAATILWTPRRSCWSVSSPNQRSTWLSQDELVGVKCRWNRGCAASQSADGRGLVGGQVVADQVHVQLGRHVGVDRGQELLELDRAVPAVQRADDRPVATSSAANRLVVPERA